MWGGRPNLRTCAPVRYNTYVADYYWAGDALVAGLLVQEFRFVSFRKAAMRVSVTPLACVPLVAAVKCYLSQTFLTQHQTRHQQHYIRGVRYLYPP